jgi:pimeloyl-ACP methyl ester carboxylesterase
MPVLVITGGDDAKFTGLGSRMVEAIGAGASLAVVPGTGHAPHLQRPRVVADLVRARPGGDAAD